MNRLAALQEFSRYFERQYRRGGRCALVIPVTGPSPDCGTIGWTKEGWLEGAARIILDFIEFRSHRD